MVDEKQPAPTRENAQGQSTLGRTRTNHQIYADAQTAPRLIADETKLLILTGELGLGTPVTEKWLTTRFHSSRTTTRDAINVLIAERYLVQEPHKSARVRSYSTQEAADILEARTVIEGFAASNCDRAPEDARARLRDAFDVYSEKAAADNPVSTAMAHVDLHVAIVGLTDNHELVRAERDLMIGSMLLVDRINWSLQDNDKMFMEHLRLVNALLLPDPVRAKSLIESHITMVAGAADKELPGTADRHSRHTNEQKPS